MKLRAQQSGAALMVMLAVIVMGASWWLVSALSTPVNRATLEADHNARVLAQAKQALLGYLAHRALRADENHPGRLPCPEPAGHVGNANYEGIAAPYITSGELTCSNAGRLPWRTLGLDKLRDANGEPLWYVVTTGANGWALQNNTTVLSINSNKLGQLTVDGQVNAAVATIIAPGRPMNLSPNADQLAAGCLTWTQRRSASPPDFRDYVECQDPVAANLRTAVVDNATNQVFNDQVVVITAREVMAAIEGPVAARIQRDIVPQLEAVYASAQWGASGTNPIFPHAANFVAFTDAATFAFKGDAARTEGLLPMTFGQCAAGSDPRCDPSFVHWAINDPDQAANPNPSVVKRVFGSTTADIDNFECVNTSTAQVVNCSITYSRDCGGGLNLGYVLGGTCYVDLEASVLARGQNVGRALRTFTTAGISVSGSPWSLVSSATPINGAGSAAADIRVQLPPASCACPALICLLFPCTASKTVIVTVPITVFADHPLLNPSTGTAWRWYTANNWHHVTYYAIAPSHAPSGPVHDCVAAGNCLSVSGSSPSSTLRAMLVLAGRTLGAPPASPRPNGDLNDFLDSAENRDADTTYEQNRIDANFNDRVITLSKY
jgi:hypothetical protein